MVHTAPLEARLPASASSSVPAESALVKEEFQSEGTHPAEEEQDADMGETEDAAEAEDFDPSEDERTMSFQFNQNALLTTHSTTGTKLLRCYWDQSALLQAEWNVPLLGKYENKDIDLWINSNEKEGVVLMDWDTFNQNAPKLHSIKAFGVLLPLTKEYIYFQSKETRGLPLRRGL